MKFSYKKLQGGVIRPIIPVEVRTAKGGPVKYFALVDSGADICIFHGEIAELIGIKDIKTGKKNFVSGITQGESQPYYIHPVTISVGGWPYDINVGFMPTLSKLGYGVLGQKGFFDLFTIKFDLSKEEIELYEKDCCICTTRRSGFGCV